MKAKAPRERVLTPMDENTVFKGYKQHAKFHDIPMSRHEPIINIPSGDNGDGFVRIGLVENEHRIRQAAKKCQKITELNFLKII